ncbi:MAG: glycosyltransferase family 4 protein [Bacteroidota bacterium]
MRILFLCDNFPPEVNAPATRTYEHCKQWVESGAKVTVITCNPNFPKGKLFPGYKNRLKSTETIDGIRVIRVWSYIAPNSGFFKRIVDYLSYAMMAFLVGLFVKCDIIVGTSPQFFTAVSARWLSFFKRKPWIMEVRDLWPESIAAVGAMNRDTFSFKMLERIEYALYKSAKAIVVVTNSFKSKIAQNGIDASKIFVVKNGVDSSKFRPREKDVELLNRLGLSGKKVIGYIGTHGMAHALDFILQCAKKIKDERIHIIMLGDGSEKERLVEMSKELKLNNITFLPFVSKSEINRYISILDVALVNLKKSDTFKTVIPSKIFENACMLKPILLGVEGETKEIIESYNAGTSYIPEDETSFMQALDKIIDANNYIHYQQGCKALSKDYERSVLAGKMYDILNRTI